MQFSVATKRPIGLLVAFVLCLMLATSAVDAAANPGKDHGLPIPELVQIPAGDFILGSSSAAREAAYQLDETAYGHSVTRRQRWYAAERSRTRRHIEAYSITRTPITNFQYAAFINATGRAAPDVERSTWKSYGLVHPYERTRRFAWLNSRPPASRDHHPVVLVSQLDASAYATWLSDITGFTWQLPSEQQWEKAARGRDGRLFPWGDTYDPALVNSLDLGPFDTLPVGSYPGGASPYGVLDAAGQVYEWTATGGGKDRAIVKGGSWDDSGCGVCRPAARHSRPIALKHILIGFRLVQV